MSTKTWTARRSAIFLGLALGALVLVYQMVGCMSASAQEPGKAAVADRADAPLTADALIRQMAQSAGVIFVGTVAAVRTPEGVAGSPADAAAGAVEVDFRVEQAVRGTRAGTLYTLREWAGLWVGGAERYRVGERRLMLLRSPDRSGLSSPVHGSEGAIPLRGTGRAPGPDESPAGRFNGLSEVPSQWMVDVRWLQAQTMRSQIRLAVPGRGPLPIRSGNGPISEGPGVARSQMVRALPGPWIDLDGVADTREPDTQVESLAHVLFVCTHAAESLDEQP